MFFVFLFTLATHLADVHAFRPSFKHQFGTKFVSSTQVRASENAQKSAEPKKGFSFTDLVQLVTMGAGAPSLGEYKRTDESGRMIFELEANNFSDEDGNSRQLKGKYFTDGYVEDDFKEKPPGFWANLLSGGELQRKWDESNEISSSK